MFILNNLITYAANTLIKADIDQNKLGRVFSSMGACMWPIEEVVATNSMKEQMKTFLSDCEFQYIENDNANLLLYKDGNNVHPYTLVELFNDSVKMNIFGIK